MLVRSYLQKMGSEVVPGLVGLLTDAESNVRGNAIDALGFIGKQADKAVPALLPLLKDNDPEVRQITAQSLGDIGVKTDDVILALIEELKDYNGYAGGSARDSLIKLTGQNIETNSEKWQKWYQSVHVQ